MIWRTIFTQYAGHHQPTSKHTFFYLLLFCWKCIYQILFCWLLLSVFESSNQKRLMPHITLHSHFYVLPWWVVRESKTTLIHNGFQRHFSCTMIRIAFSQIQQQLTQIQFPLSLVLLLTEKVLEWEFHCPCDSNFFFCKSLFSCSTAIVVLISLLTVYHRINEAAKKYDKKCSAGFILEIREFKITSFQHECFSIFKNVVWEIQNIQWPFQRHCNIFKRNF